MNYDELLTSLVVTEVRPAIVTYPDVSFGDDKTAHRWRAQWDTDYDGSIRGIALTAYPVVKLTPQGAWVDPLAWREWRNEGQSWHLTGEKRWVSNTGGQAWAKRTQEEALHSIAIRLERWARHVFSDTRKLREAAAALRTLRPDYDGYAATALRRLEGV